MGFEHVAPEGYVVGHGQEIDAQEQLASAVEMRMRVDETRHDHAPAQFLDRRPGSGRLHYRRPITHGDEPLTAECYGVGPRCRRVPGPYARVGQHEYSLGGDLRGGSAHHRRHGQHRAR